MQEKVAGYCRISVDEESDKDNISIENQKSIIIEYVAKYFPNASLDFFDDKDRSGYTFEQREGYQKLRKALFNGEYEILIVKDFSRFSRRNSLGLYELETLRDIGVRIISVGDNVDFPKNDDWLNIQFRFLMNEMPVTDTSKKVRNVIRMKQGRGEWICNVPYGYYIHPLYKNKIFIDEEGAVGVQLIFNLYNKGYGYKKIASILTERQIPTARRLNIKQLLARGYDSEKIKKLEKMSSDVWSHSSVAKIITNDFYIGNLRQGVWSRSGINKKDQRVPKHKQLVFENHHDAIIDRDVFFLAQKNYKHRSVSHYKGQRKYPNPYSGYLFCSDCGNSMFSVSNPKRPPGYICGSYHRFGLSACTSHHIHEKTLNEHVRSYIGSVKEHLNNALNELDLTKNEKNKKERQEKLNILEKNANEIKLQLKESTKQRLKQIINSPCDEEIINETFDNINEDYKNELNRIMTKINFISAQDNKHGSVRENIEKVLSTFKKVLEKETYTKQDIGIIIKKIEIDREKNITIQLNADIDELFQLLDDEKEN